MKLGKDIWQYLAIPQVLGCFEISRHINLPISFRLSLTQGLLSGSLPKCKQGNESNFQKLPYSSMSSINQPVQQIGILVFWAPAELPIKDCIQRARHPLSSFFKHPRTSHQFWATPLGKVTTRTLLQTSCWVWLLIAVTDGWLSEQLKEQEEVLNFGS